MAPPRRMAYQTDQPAPISPSKLSLDITHEVCYYRNGEAEQCAFPPETKPKMIIEEKVYELPSEDSHRLEVVEIGEMKKYETAFGTKDKFTIKIKVLDEKSSEGEDLHVFLTVSPSIGVKATLGKFLRRLKLNVTGKIDMDELVGFKFKASIAHNEGTGQSAGKTFANLVIDTVAPLTTKPQPVEQV